MTVKTRYKAYAAQVPWEWQESPYGRGDYEYDDEIYIGGNNRFIGLNEDKLTRIMDAMGEISYGLDIFASEDGNPDYESRRELIEDFLCFGEVKDFSYEDIQEIIKVVGVYDEFGYREEQEVIAGILSVLHGKEYTYHMMSGSVQSDWNYLYCPADMDWWRQLEAEYFNTGEEWCVLEDSEIDEIDPDEIDAEYVRSQFSSHYRMYVYDDAAQEIADALGIQPEEVKLFRYKGQQYTHTWG